MCSCQWPFGLLLWTFSSEELSQWDFSKVTSAGQTSCAQGYRSQISRQIVYTAIDLQLFKFHQLCNGLPKNLCSPTNKNHVMSKTSCLNVFLLTPTINCISATNHSVQTFDQIYSADTVSTSSDLDFPKQNSLLMCAISNCFPEKARTGRRHHYKPVVIRNKPKINEACAHYKHNNFASGPEDHGLSSQAERPTISLL